MIVYKITNKLNGKCYIGQTIGSLEKRWSFHCFPSKLKNNSYLSNAIKKYGKNHFSIEEIGKYSNLEGLNDAEEYFIAWHNSLAPNGYNIRLGGNNSSLSKETKLKISVKLKGRSGWNKGKKMDKEFCIKNSLAHKGKRLSEEHKQKLRGPRSDSFKAIMSRVLMGNKNTLGYKHSNESKLKISLARRGRTPWNKGRKHSEETKLKLSKIAKIREAKKRTNRIST